MDTVEAFDWLLSRPPVLSARSVLPCHVVRRRDGADVWPAFAAGVASLSGWLPDATTPKELDDCIAHGWSLMNCGVFAPDDLRREYDEVIRLVEERFKGFAMRHDPTFLTGRRSS